MPKANILIVEDSFIVALHLQTTLESEGYRVVKKCESGEDALAYLAESNRPDLILMDVMLAGTLDGIGTAAIIKENYHLPVIYITALTDKDTIQRAKVTEPYGYLTKPFEDREIFTVIEMALYKHGIETRLRESEEKYFSTVNSISDAVVVINRDYRITYMNPAALAVTQYTMADVRDQVITDVVRLRDAVTQEFPVNPIQCVVGGLNLNAMPEQLVLVGKNGLETPVGESSLSPLLDHKENFTGIILIFRDLTEKREHERLLKEIDQQRMAALIEGQEKERSRIAKDLHDGLGQMLNAIKMNANALKGYPQAQGLFRMIDEAIQESIRISENLLPAKLQNFDLATCLRSLCAQVGKTTRIPIHFTATFSGQGMEQLSKINLYRIAQEALNNAIKHAQAQHITMQLNEEGRSLRLSIEDDGRGIILSNEVDLYRKNGLINMRDRAEIMGGRLIVESDPNRGTLIIVEIPLVKSKAYAEA